MFSFKLGKPDTLNKDTKILQWQRRSTSSHVLKRFYQADKISARIGQTFKSSITI